MPQPKRFWDSVEYRYGFNGMETDPEVKGTRDHHFTTHFRQYDPRIGRWWSHDPVTQIGESPYAAMFNNPVYFSDPMGDDPPGEAKDFERNKLYPDTEDPDKSWQVLVAGEDSYVWGEVETIHVMDEAPRWFDPSAAPRTLSKAEMDRLLSEQRKWDNRSRAIEGYHEALDRYDELVIEQAQEAGNWSPLHFASTWYMFLAGSNEGFEVLVEEDGWSSVIPGLDRAQAAVIIVTGIRDGDLDWENAGDVITLFSPPGGGLADDVVEGSAKHGDEVVEGVEGVGKHGDDLIEGGAKHVDDNIGVQKIGKPASSKVLGRNMEAVGMKRPPNSAAHHIVAGTSKDAKMARKILKKAGIDINEAVNGVFLPKNKNFANPPTITHSQIHTKVYYENITKRLRNTSDVRKELRMIRSEILDGTFPYQK